MLTPGAKEIEGRGPEATVLSARDLSCSDQLKPWSERAAGGVKSEAALELVLVLAWEYVLFQVYPFEDDMLLGGVGGPPKTLPRRSGGDGLPFELGLLPPGALRLRIA